MRGRSNPWRRRLLCTVVSLIGLAEVAGCLPLYVEKRTVTGRWVGRVVPVTVYDERNRAYPAAALEILDGPPSNRPVDPKNGGGRLPLLAVGYENGYRIADPTKVPMGRVVEVRGDMSNLSLNVDLPGPGADVKVARHSSEGRPGGEHGILLRYRPKVVKGPR